MIRAEPFGRRAPTLMPERRRRRETRSFDEIIAQCEGRTEKFQRSQSVAFGQVCSGEDRFGFEYQISERAEFSL